MKPYTLWHTSPLYQIPKIGCRLWSVKQRLLLRTQCIVHFSSGHCSHHPMNADNIILRSFSIRPTPRIICYQSCGVFFIAASICQSAVLCPSTVSITHIHTSVWHCLNVWQHRPLDIGTRLQTSCTVINWVRQCIRAFSWKSVSPHHRCKRTPLFFKAVFQTFGG